LSRGAAFGAKNPNGDGILNYDGSGFGWLTEENLKATGQIGRILQANWSFELKGNVSKRDTQ
jgi:hypothetical protein